MSLIRSFFPERTDLLTLSYRQYTQDIKNAALRSKSRDSLVLLAELYDLPLELLKQCVLRLQGVYMMTRSLGDASFKDVDCQVTSFLSVGTSMIGTPEITIVDRSPFDIGIVLVTDGVTDLLTNADIARIVTTKDYTKVCNPSEQIIQSVIQKAAKQACMSVLELCSKSMGHSRRSLCDDATALVCLMDAMDGSVESSPWYILK
jgi:serine/threonine protein phosphatase PrpC